jgi:hypothetical protein
MSTSEVPTSKEGIMPSDWDASIKLLYPTDEGTFFTIDDVANGAAFDVIANVEIGKNLNENVDNFDLSVGVVNLTQSASIKTEVQSGTLSPSELPFLAELRVPISGWSASVGDVLQAVASFKVTAGVNVDFSSAQSVTFVVS